MKKRINIQRDLESRKSISEYKAFPAVHSETVTVNQEVENAKSETDREQETDQKPKEEDIPKKRRRKTEGDI